MSLHDDLEAAYVAAAGALAGVLEAARTALDRYYERTGQKAGYLLVGWETWLQLGKELRRRGTLEVDHSQGFLAAGGPEQFMGYTVVVDETVAHLLRALPQPRNVRPRTRPSALPEQDPYDY